MLAGDGTLASAKVDTQTDPSEEPTDAGPENQSEPATDLEAVHKEAMERYEAGWSKDRSNQNEAYEDLRFLADAETGQWDAKARADRESEQRPILTVNKCPQFVRQVTGDIRQMRPAIKVTPVDDAASEQVGVEVLPGLLRYIERRSDAKAAYFNGADQMVAAGIGHCRVFTEYAAGTTFDQEIGIGIIEDGVAVVWDPDSNQPSRKDAMFCFVPIDMNKKKAEKKWPDKDFTPLTMSSEAFNGWWTDDHVRVSEYWRKVPMKRTLAQYPDGKLVDLTDDPKGEKRGDAEAAGATIDERDSYRVERFIMSAAEILEDPEEWPGAHIPIVPFMGEEIKIGRQVVRRGVIRTLKDVQMLYNYAISADCEAVALQPKAPFKGTRKNFEKYLDQWEVANTKNQPFLEYEPDPSNGGAAPQREPPPVASSGIKELLNVATGDMSAVTGIYPASLGQQGNEASGKAIVARQREGDTGTYVFVEAFGRAIQRVGEIVVDLVPHIYDTKRTIRIVGEDGKVDKMVLNEPTLDPNGDGVDTITMNDVTVGTYEVSVEMGPSFSTKREEARDGMQSLMQALGPQTAPLFADLYVKSQDFPLADQIAKRAKFLLPPNIQQAEAAEAGEEPPNIPQQQPPPPTPEQQMEMATKKAKHELDLANIELEKAKLPIESAKVDLERQKVVQGHEQAMAGHAATMAQAQADPRIDALVAAVEALNKAVVHLADEIDGKLGEVDGKFGEMSKPESAKPDDHTPRLLDIIAGLTKNGASAAPPPAFNGASPAGIAPPMEAPVGA